MPRKRKGNPIHGWVVFDKPLEMSSTQAVGKVRWLFTAQKAGHGGTLDPLATGILPIALGDAIAGIEIPVVEVHISNVHEREPFRHRSYVSASCARSIIGEGLDGYKQAVEWLIAENSN